MRKASGEMRCYDNEITLIVPIRTNRRGQSITGRRCRAVDERSRRETATDTDPAYSATWRAASGLAVVDEVIEEAPERVSDVWQVSIRQTPKRGPAEMPGFSARAARWIEFENDRLVYAMSASWCSARLRRPSRQPRGDG